MATSATVPVFSPDGKLGDIPQDQLMAAIKHGARPGVTIKSPDGKLGVVPAEKYADAVKAGAQVVSGQDQENQHPGFWHAFAGDLAGMAKGAVGSAVGLTPGADLIPSDIRQKYGIRTPLDSAKDTFQNAGDQWKRETDAGRSTGYKVVAAAGPVVGLNVSGMEQAADEGDVAGVAGHAAAPLAVAAAAKGAEAASSYMPAFSEIDLSRASKITDAGKGALAKVGSAATAVSKTVNPDFVGLVSPRAAHALRLANQIGKVATKLGTETPAEAPAAPAQLPAAFQPLPPRAPAVPGTVDLPFRPQLQDLSGESPAPPPAAIRPELPAAFQPLPKTAPPVPGTVDLPFRGPAEQLPLSKLNGAEAQAAPVVTPKAVEAQLTDALGGRPLQKNVPLRSQVPAAAAKLPEGFQPVQSSALQGFKYDPTAREFSSITKDGRQYVHGDVSPEEAQAFIDADSKGKAWAQLKSQSPLVAKVVNGKRIAVVKSAGAGAAADEAPGGVMQTETDLTSPLKESLRNVTNLPRDAAGKPIRFVYRARDVGEEGVPVNNFASATTDAKQATAWAEPGNRSATQGQVVRIDLSKLSPKDYVVKQHPDGMSWVQFTRPLAESDVVHFAGASKNAGK